MYRFKGCLKIILNLGQVSTCLSVPSYFFEKFAYFLFGDLSGPLHDGFGSIIAIDHVHIALVSQNQKFLIESDHGSRLSQVFPHFLGLHVRNGSRRISGECVLQFGDRIQIVLHVSPPKCVTLL